MRYTLNAIALVEPEWILSNSNPEWVKRYSLQMNEYHLPNDRVKREALAIEIGQDGIELLNTLDDEATPEWLRQLPAVQILRRVWIENYVVDQKGQLRWRTSHERPPASRAIWSPYDSQAQFSKKRATTWVGYKVHFTETCEKDHPRLITHVETTAAPVSDVRMTSPIHQALQQKGCLPDKHIVDSGYVNAKVLVESQRDYSIDLIGPTRRDTGWQSQNNSGFASRDFVIDWDKERAICPANKTSIRWLPAVNNKGKSIIQIHFSKQDCRPCKFRPQCTRSDPPRRSITVLPQSQQEALLEARQREKTEEYAELYRQRAGVEGVFSQGARACGLRRSRYIGLAKTRLQHHFTAMAINLIRVGNWLGGIPVAQTHSSAFARLHLAT